MEKLTIEEKFTKIREENPDKSFEILEWEIREVDPEEWIKFRENPLDFPPSVQRKYFGVSAEDYKFPSSIDPNEEWFEVPEGKYVHSYIATNPYTKEEKEIFEYRQIPVPPEPTKIEIGDKILEEVFEGNPYAQIADLTKSQVTTLKLLVPILWKDNIKIEYADLIDTLKKISNARIENWLLWFDLSFLE